MMGLASLRDCTCVPAPETLERWHAMPGTRGLGAFKAPSGNMYSPFPQGRPFWYPVFPNAATPALVPGADRGVYLNPAKDSEHFFWLSGQGPSSAFPVTVPAGGTVTVTFNPPSEESTQGDYEIIGFLGTWSVSTARFTTDFNAAGLDRKLTPSGGFLNNMLYGTFQFPHILFESVMIQAGTPLTALLTNLSAVTAFTVKLMAIGRRFLEFDEEIQARRRERFYQRRTHPVFLIPDEGAAVSVAGLAAQTFNFQVPSHADFECWASYDDSDGTYDGQFFEGLSSRGMCDIANVDSQSFLTSPSTTIAAWPTGILRACMFPGTWLYTHVFKRNSKIRFKTTDTSGATNVMRVGLHGRLIYYGLPDGCPPTGSYASLEPSVGYVNAIGPTRRPSPFLSPAQLDAERFRC